jgi:hypothetical protein
VRGTNRETIAVRLASTKGNRRKVSGRIKESSEKPNSLSRLRRLQKVISEISGLFKNLSKRGTVTALIGNGTLIVSSDISPNQLCQEQWRRRIEVRFGQMRSCRNFQNALPTK